MSDLKHPYYIMSPDYRESSGGIQALHKLCHQINLHGGRAWMVDCTHVNPAWNTPRLDAKTYDQHKAAGLIPIAVYPEIYSGNLLNADVCVRYMLNHEALLNGNRLDETEEDLFFWYSSQLIIKEPEVDFLTMVGPDLEMFSDDGRVKTTRLLYLNRVPEEHVDFTRLPEDIIVISVKKPRPLAELAGMLKSAQVMYTFEWSGTCNLAALCGTPVVSMVAKGYEKLAISDASIRDMGGAGVCFSDDEAELARTRAGLYKVREHMNQFEANFSRQLMHFFAVTQKAAQSKCDETCMPAEAWLASYPLCHPSLSAATPGLSVRVVMLGEDSSPAAASTRLSLSRLNLKVESYSEPETGDQPPQAQRFSHWLARLLAEDQHEWVLFLRAGDRVCPDIFSGLTHFKEKLDRSLAFYTDRLLRNPQGELTSLFLPDFDPDSFLAMPERFARGSFFRRELCLEIVRSRDVPVHAVETAFLLALASAGLTQDIQHIPLPLLDVVATDDQESLTASLLAEHLAIRGYEGASVSRSGDALFSIDYPVRKSDKLTVIIVVEDEIDRVKRLLSTFVDSVSAVDYEIIFIDNVSADQRVREWLSSLSDVNSDLFRVFLVDEKISAVSALNYALSVARGTFALHLSCGTYFNNKTWLQALLNHCGRPDILACAPRLLGDDNQLYSSALIDGHRRRYGPADAAHTATGWLAAEQAAPQQCLLLSSECLMIRTASFHQAGGLREEFTDVHAAISDLLLRAADKASVNLYVPMSQVCCDKLMSEKALSLDAPAFTERWLARLAQDPRYNPNLSWNGNAFVRENSHLRIAARSGRALSALLIFDPADFSEAHRVKAYARSVTQAGADSVAAASHSVSLSEVYRIKPASLVLSDLMAHRHSSLLSNKQLLPDTRVIIEVTRASMRPKSQLRSSDDLLGKADLLLFRNAAALKSCHYHNSMLQADRLDAEWQGLAIARQQRTEQDSQPRVGIVMTDLRQEDWRHIDTLIREMSEQVCWIIYGACPDAWKPYIHEYHRKVPQKRLAQKFQALNLSLALAPLADCWQNQAEGHRVIAQLGACGYPVLASDHDAYRAIGHIQRLTNKTSQWRFMMNKMLRDPGSLRTLGERLYQEINAGWIYPQAELPAWLIAGGS
ncbi:O-antigen biosynthesis protein [Pantoea deleyi]|uniref:Glycosyltransferase family 2 protein n=1 Tax=Pantoea deleyi TaxID=470932 RepID=A0A506QHQ0_9GAMM|nr:glycosyltransferase [Pantoea deleyi]ORM85045.1 O-antigen biosynthesis protein [Pantoea deleyi]TPV45339.1 glycosyltransferase family 2 protein [Pantoea deleyi]